MIDLSIDTVNLNNSEIHTDVFLKEEEYYQTLRIGNLKT